MTSQSPSDPEGAPPTARAAQRQTEEQQFLRVIVKRNDEARRHPDDVLELAIQEGAEQLKRPVGSLLLSAVAAGLILGFTVLAVGVMKTLTIPLDNALLERLLTALVYPLGFIICIGSGTELFTEHTATAVYPVLDRRASPLRLLRLWGLVLAGNLVGALLSALILWQAEPVVQATLGYVAIGKHLVEFGNPQLLASSIVAGWLMAQGAWLILATPPGGSQILAIYIVTFVIGLGHLHHSIAGSVEVFTALLVSDAISGGEALRFIVVAVIGNLIGGSGFVALLTYGHVRKTRSVQEER